jgi:thymidylate synthase (FAD)
MSSIFSTKRSTVEGLEAILGRAFPLLDNGFIRVIDYMGDDGAIVQAARVSYGKGTKKINQDQGLINYLLRHSHTTPFEMCEIKFHLKMPIFVARQWIRHRTASVNEYSARYSLLDREFYLPEPDQIKPQSEVNKQGRNSDELSTQERNRILEIIKKDSEKAYQDYLEMLNLTSDDNQNQPMIADPNKKGVARELARINLSLNYYTQFYWKIDLHNWMHFLRLRADSHAQYEIRVYAEKMLEIFKLWLPLTYQAFENYSLKATKLSLKGKNLIIKLLKGEKIDQESSELSPGEWREIMEQFNLE